MESLLVAPLHADTQSSSSNAMSSPMRANMVRQAHADTCDDVVAEDVVHQNEVGAPTASLAEGAPKYTDAASPVAQGVVVDERPAVGPKGPQPQMPIHDASSSQSRVDPMPGTNHYSTTPRCHPQ